MNTFGAVRNFGLAAALTGAVLAAACAAQPATVPLHAAVNGKASGYVAIPDARVLGCRTRLGSFDLKEPGCVIGAEDSKSVIFVDFQQRIFFWQRYETSDLERFLNDVKSHRETVQLEGNLEGNVLVAGAAYIGNRYYNLKR